MHGRRVRRLAARSYLNGPRGQAGASGGDEDGLYRLPRHVFLCSSGRYTVFLDLRADRYFAVETGPATPVLRRIDGWVCGRAADPAAASVATGQPRAADAAGERRLGQLTRTLLDRGLLTRDRGAGRPVETVAIETPEQDFADVGLDELAPLRARDIVRFVSAVLGAWLAYRCLPLERLVRRVSRRRARRGARAGPFDPALARHCVSVYSRLRPLAFSARDACLFESLAFLELAARYGLHPMWVFGVQATPFAAHCWVQQGRLALTGSAEQAAGYTPILLA